jgi:hypothetical protein
MAKCGISVGEEYVIACRFLSTLKGQYFNFHLLIAPISNH